MNQGDCDAERNCTEREANAKGSSSESLLSEFTCLSSNGPFRDKINLSSH